MLIDDFDITKVRCTECMNDNFDFPNAPCYYTDLGSKVHSVNRLGLYEDIGYTPLELIEFLIEYESEHNNTKRVDELEFVKIKAKIVERQERAVYKEYKGI